MDYRLLLIKPPWHRPFNFINFHFGIETASFRSCNSWYANCSYWCHICKTINSLFLVLANFSSSWIFTTFNAGSIIEFANGIKKYSAKTGIVDFKNMYKFTVCFTNIILKYLVIVNSKKIATRVVWNKFKLIST